MQKSLRRRLLTIFVKLSVVVVVSLLLLEITLRFLLFSTLADGWGIARQLRRPEKFANAQHDDAHWILQHEFLPADVKLSDEPPGYDPELGWGGALFTPKGRLIHPDIPHIGARRPVVLFGDSYAQCNTPPEDCFQSLMERSHLGRQYCLINLGVGGYGLDQVYLLLRRALETLARRNPIIVVSMLIEDDMDRTALSFRCWPKPRLELRDGELELEERPVPTMQQYFATHSPGIASYAWNNLVHGTSLLSLETKYRLTGEAETARHLQELNRAILTAIVREIEARKLDYFFLLFYSEGATINPPDMEWRETFLIDTLRSLNAPWVSSRWAMLAHSKSTGLNIPDYFGHEGELVGHHNPLGNRVAFHALRAGLAGHFEPEPSGFSLSASDLAEVAGQGKGGEVSFESAPLDSTENTPLVEQLVMSVGDAGLSQARYSLRGEIRSFRADVGLVPPPGTRCDRGSAQLSIWADGALLQRATFRSGEPLRPIEVDLSGKKNMRLVADDAGDGNECDRIVLAWPWFE